MKATFLEASVPLTKTFYLKDGKIEKIGHPRILDYTSHEKEYSTIEELATLLKLHADMGHCFLKGSVSRPLTKEPRAGTTDPNAATSLLLLDLDGIKGVDTVDEFLNQTKLNGSDYIVQYSSSMGVLPERGMSAHIFVLLNKEHAPAILKQYLIQFNLTLPLLKQNLALTRTYNALRWPLDVTTCQNDKLIYIAPPLLKDGIEDKLEGERIHLVVGKRRHLSLPAPFPNAETNKSKTQDALNELRTTMGLEKRLKTQMRVKGNTEYMARPDKAVVTGVKVGEPFTHLNLNGGDSWGYYHPTNNPEFIHNFKSEPIYKTSELLPEYWAEVKNKMNETRVTEDGRAYLAFRDFRTDTYYNGIYNIEAQSLQLAVAKSKDRVFDFLKQHDQPVPEFLPDGVVKFDPHMEGLVNLETMTVNTYQPSAYMRMKPRRGAKLTPVARKIMLHALGGDEEILEHFLNSIAVIVQYKIATGTGWVLQGVPGTGKGLMLDKILRPIIGMDYVVTKRIREIDSQFNGFMEKALVIWVDEAEQNDFNKRGAMNADIKNMITEPRISVRKMHTMPYEVTNYATWFFASNKSHIIEIDVGDRRFNVGVYQPNKLVITDAELSQLEDELPEMHSYLATRVADKGVARTPLNNPAKQKMILLNQAAIDVAADAINGGNLEFFWDQRFQGDLSTLAHDRRDKAEAYTKLLLEIIEKNHPSLIREELQILLDYAIGGMPTSSHKFTSFLKHHKMYIETISRGGKSYRGIPVKWKINPEWKE